jgi:hypothetical protein
MLRKLGRLPPRRRRNRHRKRRGRGQRPRNEPQQAEPRRNEPRQAEPRRNEPQQAEPRLDEPQQAEPRRNEPQQAEPRRDVQLVDPGRDRQRPQLVVGNTPDPADELGELSAESPAAFLGAAADTAGTAAGAVTTTVPRQ